MQSSIPWAKSSIWLGFCLCWIAVDEMSHTVEPGTSKEKRENLMMAEQFCSKLFTSIQKVVPVMLAAKVPDHIASRRMYFIHDFIIIALFVEKGPEWKAIAKMVTLCSVVRSLIYAKRFGVHKQGKTDLSKSNANHFTMHTIVAHIQAYSYSHTNKRQQTHTHMYIFVKLFGTWDWKSNISKVLQTNKWNNGSLW